MIDKVQNCLCLFLDLAGGSSIGLVKFRRKRGKARRVVSGTRSVQ